MKKLLFSLSLIVASTGLFGQYYYNQVSAGQNPGGLNTDDEYPNGGGLSATWTQILSGSRTTPAWSATQTLPFSFNFNGSPVTQYKVSSSGVLTFTTGAASVPAYSAISLPSATIPDNSVCVLGVQGIGSNDNIMRKTFGTAPNRQEWIFFASYTAVSNSSYWTYWSIVLEETTNNIYIVDQRHAAAVTGMSLGVQVNSSTAYTVSGSPAISNQAAADATSADNVYYEFLPGTRPAYDMTTTSSSVSEILILNQAPFSITGKVKNLGATTVTSYDMNYTVNAGATVTGSVSSSITTGSEVNFTHPTTWTPPSTGTYTIETWATNINGNPDANTANDKYSYTVEVVDTFVTRKTLMEVFTSSTCGPCTAGNAHMDGTIVPQISNYTIIKYQQNFPGAGDPYATTESVNRRSAFYGITSIPRMEIDGQWDQNASSLTTGIFNSYQSEPAFVGIDITSATYSGTTATINATITPLTNLTGNLKYHVVINEKRTTGNIATNGETEFFHVMMDMIPNENGNSLTSLSANVPTNVVKTSNLITSNVEEMSDLQVVVFVQDMSTGDVYQSEWADIQGNASINENETSLLFNVYPNPSNGEVNVKIENESIKDGSISVINILGETVFSKSISNSGNLVNMDLSNYGKGVYLIKVESGNITATKKITIQ